MKKERAVFFTQIGSFDTHKDLHSGLGRLLPNVNAALKTFKQEMQAQGNWDNVVVVTLSDFARTLTSNGRGTDHAWGGHNIITGGKVRGGQIHGEYPDDLRSSGPLNVGKERGRLIPTRGWESLWNGISEWMGVEAGQMDTVLPNRKNYDARLLFSKADLFRD